MVCVCIYLTSKTKVLQLPSTINVNLGWRAKKKIKSDKTNTKRIRPKILTNKYLNLEVFGRGSDVPPPPLNTTLQIPYMAAKCSWLTFAV